ncbi:MAG: glutathione peroxidase [Hyphomonadaceae bacterium]|nr:glutathione peroxidase [Hyphomonadaceae bacterium]
MTTAHDFTFKQLDGAAPVALKDFAGKVVLLVNVASACGLTPQYGPLEKLYEAKKDAGLVVLGAPCNDFGAQESGTEGEIGSFCETNFGVTFPMTGKIAIVSEPRHPFYEWVKSELGSDALPKWNFHKYLIGKNGELVATFSSMTAPDAPEITSAIDAALKA